MKQNRKKPPKPEPNKVDEASAESFPASDPPSYMGSTAVAGSPRDGHAKSRGPEPVVREGRKSVDLNAASKEELGSLPALSPMLVDALVDNRPFSGWEDIRRVPGFDQNLIEQLQQGGAQLKH
jgi:DNA uptake protein ComE-like DNA-binding protein